MKVLFLGSSFLPERVGAVELHMKNAARSLIGRGHEVLVFCRGYAPARPEFAVDQAEYEGVPVRRMNYKFSDCVSFERTYSNPNIRAAFEKVFREFQPDIVHVHHLFAMSMDIPALVREAGVPLVMTLHDFWMGCPRTQRMTASLETCPEIILERCLHCLRGLWPGFFAEGRGGSRDRRSDADDLALLERYHQMVRGVLTGADRLIAPSRFVKSIYERYGIPKRTISVARNGIDPSLFAKAARTRSPIFRFGYLGPVIPSKGVHILIEAFQTIGGSDCSLDIWGEVLPYHKDTNYGHRLAVLAKGWETSIYFRGRYENRDVARVLGDLDAVVFPSLWYEACPMTVQEAFLAGTPVIVSNFGGLSEIVDDETTGLFFNVGDSVDLSEKMKALKEDSALRRKLAESPKNVPSMEENADALLEIYSKAAGRKAN